MKKFTMSLLSMGLILTVILCGCGGSGRNGGGNSIGSAKLIVVGQSSKDKSWMIKGFDAAGREVPAWNKKFGSEYGECRAYGAAADSNNNIYVVGYYTINSPNDRQWWIKKFSAAGVEDPNRNKILGSDGYDTATSVAVDSQNNVYVVGCKTTSENKFNWWIKAFNSDGTERWEKTLGGTNDAIAQGVAIDSENNIYVVGYQSRDWLIQKFSSDGTLVNGWGGNVGRRRFRDGYGS